MNVKQFSEAMGGLDSGTLKRPSPIRQKKQPLPKETPAAPPLAAILAALLMGTADGNEVAATFLWTMYFIGKGWDAGTDEGVEQMVTTRFQVVAEVGEDSAIDVETASVLMANSGRGGPNYSTPIEELFPKQLTE